MGYIPVLMAPSILGSALNPRLEDALSRKGVEFQIFDAISLIGHRGDRYTVNSKTSMKDIWVKRTVAAELMGIEESKVTTIDFLGWCLL